MDDSSTPPNLRVELYPVPDAVYAIPYVYASEASELAGSSGLTILQVWMQRTALFEGVCARIKAHLKDYEGAEYSLALAGAALQTMRRAEAQGMAPAQMKLDSYYTSHRMRRCR
jgi:hypothetical protein